eukprot:357718-Chlamydomonas_euryale.AAC.3
MDLFFVFHPIPAPSAARSRPFVLGYTPFKPGSDGAVPDRARIGALSTPIHPIPHSPTPALGRLLVAHAQRAAEAFGARVRCTASLAADTCTANAASPTCQNPDLDAPGFERLERFEPSA